MWDSLLLHAHLATMAAGRAVYGEVRDGAVGVAGGRIAWVGSRQALPGSPERLAAVVHDLGGAWVTPGLIDCHTHLVHAGHRSHEFEQRLSGASYEQIAAAGGGILSTVRATRRASAEQLERESLPRLHALLAEGVTTVEIKSGYGLERDTELRQLRVARRLGVTCPVTVKTTFLGAHTVPPEFANRADAYVELLCQEMLPAAAAEALVDAVDAYCERQAFTPAQVGRLFVKAKQLGVPVKLHADQRSDSGGAALAARHAALSADHLEYTTAAGVEALAAAGTVAVLLPGAFYFLRETQRPPVETLRAQGVPIALASDCNPGTSPAGSLLLMLNLACTLLRLHPEEALAGITRHAARALGLANTHGTIEAGKAADLAWYAIDHPNELSYRLGGNPCVGVMRAGVLRAPNTFGRDAEALP